MVTHLRSTRLPLLALSSARQGLSLGVVDHEFHVQNAVAWYLLLGDRIIPLGSVDG